MTRSTRMLISTAFVIVGLLAVFVGTDGDPAYLSDTEGVGLICTAVAMVLAFMPARRDDP